MQGIFGSAGLGLAGLSRLTFACYINSVFCALQSVQDLWRRNGIQSLILCVMLSIYRFYTQSLFSSLNCGCVQLGQPLGALGVLLGRPYTQTPAASSLLSLTSPSHTQSTPVPGHFVLLDHMRPNANFAKNNQTPNGSTRSVNSHHPNPC